MNAWLLSLGLPALTGAGVFCRAVFMPRSQICGKVIFRGPRTSPPGVALTFDDGPDDLTTAAVLDALRRHDTKAAFFVVGQHAARWPDLIRRMDGEGHIVGNHSFEHGHFGSMRRDRYWEDEIRRTDDVIERIIGKRPALFRPPMGFKTFHITRAAARNGHTVVTWTRRAYDRVRRSPEPIASKLGAARAGDIVVMHDGAVQPFHARPDQTLATLELVLNAWKNDGINVTRLDEFLQTPAYRARGAATSATRVEAT